MKIIQKSKLPRAKTQDKTNTPTDVIGTLNEMNVLKGMVHPHIVQLKEVIGDENDKNIYLVM